MTDPPRRPAGHRPPFSRVIGLSDAVFAISITLLVLELRPPEEPAPGPWAHHERGLPAVRHVRAGSILPALGLAFFVALIPLLGLTVRKESEVTPDLT